MITVYAPKDTTAFIRQVAPGLHRFAIDGVGRYLREDSLRRYYDPLIVKRVIDWMQETVPLGCLDGLEVFCFDMQLTDTPDYTRPDIAGEYIAGKVLLSGYFGGQSLHDVLTHELTHAVARKVITRLEEDEFFALIGVERGDERDPQWGDRPQEHIAEYISGALWGQPINGVPPITNEALARVRAFAMAQFEEQSKAKVFVYGEAEPEEGIVLTIGSNIARVDGEEVLLDTAPIIHLDRTLVPVRFIAEHFGLGVTWDEAKREVRIKQKPPH